MIPKLWFFLHFIACVFTSFFSNGSSNPGALHPNNAASLAYLYYSTESYKEKIKINTQKSTRSHHISNNCHNTYKLDEGAVCPISIRVPQSHLDALDKKTFPAAFPKTVFYPARPDTVSGGPGPSPPHRGRTEKRGGEWRGRSVSGTEKIRLTLPPNPAAPAKSRLYRRAFQAS
jgi:hypothetical protein